MRKQITIKFETGGVKKTLKAVLELGEMFYNVPKLKINENFADVWYDEDAENLDVFSLTWYDSDDWNIAYEAYFKGRGTEFDFSCPSHLFVQDVERGIDLYEVKFTAKVTNK